MVAHFLVLLAPSGTTTSVTSPGASLSDAASGDHNIVTWGSATGVMNRQAEAWFVPDTYGVGIHLAKKPDMKQVSTI
jgi:hypothetical protein